MKDNQSPGKRGNIFGLGSKNSGPMLHWCKDATRHSLATDDSLQWNSDRVRSETAAAETYVN